MSLIDLYLEARALVAQASTLAEPWKDWTQSRIQPELDALLLGKMPSPPAARSQLQLFHLPESTIVQAVERYERGDARALSTIEKIKPRCFADLGFYQLAQRAFDRGDLAQADDHAARIESPYAAMPIQLALALAYRDSGQVEPLHRFTERYPDLSCLEPRIALLERLLDDPSAARHVKLAGIDDLPHRRIPRTFARCDVVHFTASHALELALMIDLLHVQHDRPLFLTRRLRGALWCEEAPLRRLCTRLLALPDRGEAWLRRLTAFTKIGAAIRARLIVHAIREMRLPERVAQIESDLDTSKVFLRGARGDRDFGESLPETLRPWFDRGLALSVDTKRHRRTLVQACVRSLKRAWERTDPRDEALVHCRLDTLIDLAGDHASRALASLVARPHPLFGIAALDALAQVDARSATTMVFKRYREVTGDGRYSNAMLSTLEKRGLLEEGYACSWRNAAERGAEVLGVEGIQRWLGAVAVEWWQRSGRAVSPSLLDSISSRELDPSPDPKGQVQAAFAAAAAMHDEPPLELVRKLYQRPRLVSHLLCFSTIRIAGSSTWTIDRWIERLKNVERQAELGRVYRDLVRRFAEKIRPKEPELLTERLLRGRPPIERSIELPNGWSLRLLDKTRDLFTYLRFADSVPCCFNSSSNTGWHQSQITELWKDPLSFCFSIEKKNGPCRESHGFVFGSFGTAAGDRPIALLNGIYLRRQEMSLRFEILRGIEECFARPLNLVLIGIANQHGGEGPLPPDYREQVLPVRRWRAIRNRSGGTQLSIYDDLALDANEDLRAKLFWKTLQRSTINPSSAN